MFEVDFRGLSELEGGKPPHRLALELIANVFDEKRGYVEGRKSPSFCAVTLAYQHSPRGVLLTVADDGAGFENERDVWTIFGSTPKRGVVGVGGRFNLGEKQCIAVARSARIRTNAVTVTFEDGKREVTRHRTVQMAGTIVEMLMPWSLKDQDEVRGQLFNVLPPAGLSYTVDGMPVQRPEAKCTVQVALPTVKLQDGVMRPTMAKTAVTVVKTNVPTLFELGIPICELSEFGFPWSLDVQQKIPVPPSRDTVSPAYIFRVIGTVIEQTTMDGIILLTEEEEGAPFVKGALDWVRNADALREAMKALYGDPVIRSNDPIANANAAANGSTLVPRPALSPETRRRARDGGIPTSKERYGAADPELPRKPSNDVQSICPHCGGALNL